MQRAAPQLLLFPDDAAALPSSRPGSAPGFSVRESARARRLSIKVYPRGRVEVVVPRRTRPADVEQFVRENREWIRRAREEFADQYGAGEFRLPERVALAAINREYVIRYVPDRTLKTVRFRASRDTVTLRGRVSDEQQCVVALRRWLASVAKTEFAPRLASLATLTDTRYARMQVRAQRTCWGSRSCSGTVSLNMCLLFLKPSLLRYLLIHELCHGRHMNHSRRFWNLVRQFEPDYRRLDRELGESWRDVPVWMGLA